MSEKDVALERLVRDRLRALHLHLQIVHAGIVVAAAALHHQNAERDEEIARVLEYCVGDRLADQIERTAELIASLLPLPTDPADIDSWDPRSERRGVSEAVRSPQLAYMAAAASMAAGGSATSSTSPAYGKSPASAC